MSDDERKADRQIAASLGLKSVGKLQIALIGPEWWTKESDGWWYRRS